MSELAKLDRSVKLLTACVIAVVLLLAYLAWLKDWDIEKRVRKLEAWKLYQLDFNDRMIRQ